VERNSFFEVKEMPSRNVEDRVAIGKFTCH